MRLITSAALLCAALQLFVMTSPAMADDGTNCEKSNAKDDLTIYITIQSGNVVACPNPLYAYYGDIVTWTPDNPNWTWSTKFADDKHSPFDPGKTSHGNGNDHDKIRQCSDTNPCSYVYSGTVTIDDKKYPIDPTIIVNPNARPPHKKNEQDKK